MPSSGPASASYTRPDRARTPGATVGAPLGAPTAPAPAHKPPTPTGAAPPTPADDLLCKASTDASLPKSPPADPASPFDADMSVTGVHAAIAETGSLVICAEPGSPRLASLAVPVHVAVVRESQVLPDLLDWADWQQTVAASTGQVLISGPSKTADIELNLVTGVHGPGEVHVILLADR